MVIRAMLNEANLISPCNWCSKRLIGHHWTLQKRGVTDSVFCRVLEWISSPHFEIPWFLGKPGNLALCWLSLDKTPRMAGKWRTVTWINVVADPSKGVSRLFCLERTSPYMCTAMLFFLSWNSAKVEALIRMVHRSISWLSCSVGVGRLFGWTCCSLCFGEIPFSVHRDCMDFHICLESLIRRIYPKKFKSGVQMRITSGFKVSFLLWWVNWLEQWKNVCLFSFLQIQIYTFKIQEQHDVGHVFRPEFEEGGIFSSNW